MSRLQVFQYKNEDLDIRLFPYFISGDEPMLIYNYILNNAKFAYSHYTQKGILSKRKNKAVYGSIPYYVATYQGNTVHTPVNSWDELPYLKQLSLELTKITGQEYHVCVIQLYNSGEVGINPHRDKEMKHGTIITSLSLGTGRIMRFEKNGKIVDIPLNPGALCLIMPPTNDTWLHSIPKDETTTPRISLIFRNCEGMS